MSTLILTFGAGAVSDTEIVKTFGPDQTGEAGKFIESASEYGEPFLAYLVSSYGRVHETTQEGHQSPCDDYDYATVRITFTSVDSDDTYVAHFSIDGRA